MPAPYRKNEQLGLLVLEDGKEFPGTLFGAPASATPPKDRGYGEIVFNTSMTGYQEILTDPSYYGQIVCMTVPHIGNTGINLEDPESIHPWASGLIIHDLAESPSNWRATGRLEDYMRQHGIPGICGIDTRALTRHLRSLGVTRGMILPESEKSRTQEHLSKLPSFEGRDMISEVSGKSGYKPLNQGRYNVVVMDFGVKWNLLKSLEERDCKLEIVSAKTSAREILGRRPDGVFLSNGPGDPAAATYAVETVRELVGKVPLFGVCMGHQVLALALGAKTYKMKFGHRGGNQPVLDLVTRRVEISSHNHGYSVDADSLPSDVEVTHLNLNDKTVEGLRVKGKNAFSVQYHPEACPGPHDSAVLFERFIESLCTKSTLNRS